MRRIVVFLSIVFLSVVVIGQQIVAAEQGDFGNFSTLIAQNKGKATNAKGNAKGGNSKGSSKSSSSAKDKAKEAKAKEKAKADQAKAKAQADKKKEAEKAKKDQAKAKADQAKEKEKASKDKAKADQAKEKEKAKADLAKEKAKASKNEAKEKSSSKNTAQAKSSASADKKAQAMKDKAKAEQAKEKEKAQASKQKEIEKAKKDQAKEKEKASSAKAAQAQKEKQKQELARKQAEKRKENEKAHAQQLQTKKTAQKDNEKSVKSVEDLARPGIGAHPYKPSNKASTKYTHLAMYLDGGLSLPYTDYSTDKLPLNAYGSFTFMYHFNPLWGLGLNYTFHNLDVKPKYYNVVGESDLSKLSYGALDANGEQVYEVYKKHVNHIMNDASLLLSFNLRNAWFPYATKDLFNLYLLCGLGGSFFSKSNVYFYYERHNHSLDAGQEESATGKMRIYTKEKEGASLVVTPGLLFDFNVARSVSIGVKTMLNIYPQDNIEYWKSGTQPDMLLDVGLSLRYKFDAEVKTNVCNITSMQSLSRAPERDRRESSFDADSIRKIIKSMKRVRDTVVVLRSDTIYIAANANGDGAYSTEHHQEDTTPLIQVMKSNIFFVPNSAALSDYSDNILKEVAQKMDEDQSIIAEIMGYNDLTGTEAANKKIALKRANIVANQLVNIYKIDRSRIKYIGQGTYKNSNAVQNTAVSRRVQIILYKP